MLLAIETSGRGFSLALAEPPADSATRPTIRSVVFGHPIQKRPIASRLLPALDFLLRDAGVAKSDLTRVGVSAGPGGFTGLRSGLAAGKTIASQLGLPLVLTPTLLARTLWHLDGNAPADQPLIIAVDARRQQVYGAIYRWNENASEWQTLLKPQCAAIGDFIQSAAQVLGASDGREPIFCREPDLLKAGVEVPANWKSRCRRGGLAPTALEIAALTAASGDDLAPVDPMKAEPLYVRPPDAKLPKIPQPPLSA